MVEGARSGDQPGDVATIVDGRTARRDRNFEAVMDATIALIAEGRLTPTAADVAVRSGVSQRSVNRYFGDVRTLQQAAAEREVTRGIPLFRIHAIGTGPRDHRVEEFVEVRIRAHLEIGPTARAATLYAATSKYIQAQMEVVRVLMRDQVERQFAPELEVLESQERAAMVLAVDTLFQFESLDHNLRELAIPPAELNELLCAVLRQLLSTTKVGRKG